MIDPTKIKDGIIVIAILGVAIGGYLVARKVIDGVGSIGQGVGEFVDAVKETAIKAVEPLKPTIKTDDLPGLTDYERTMIEMFAAGGMGA